MSNLNRTFCLARASLALLLAGAFSIGSCSAAIQSFTIRDTFSTDGFSASWLHGGTDAVNGSAANGARRSGLKTDRISGTMQGDLANNQLTDISGSVNGQLQQLAIHLGSGTNMSDNFTLQLGANARNGTGKGALQFMNGGGAHTGGFLDFSLVVGASSILDGTFFFKPQAESGAASLSPNRGSSNEFTLWGNNWMHDGDPVDGSTALSSSEWLAFLVGLGYTEGEVLLNQQLTGESDLAAALGIDLYVANDDQGFGQQGTSTVPEPTTMFVWSLLIALSVSKTRKLSR